MDKDLHIVLQNYNDKTFIESKKWEQVVGDVEVGEEFTSDPKLNKVPLTAFIIPGKELHEEFLRLYMKRQISWRN